MCSETARPNPWLQTDAEYAWLSMALGREDRNNGEALHICRHCLDRLPREQCLLSRAWQPHGHPVRPAISSRGRRSDLFGKGSAGEVSSSSRNSYDTDLSCHDQSLCDRRREADTFCLADRLWKRLDS